jgi:hypothetical protein
VITWRAAEQRIGAELPAALREAYLLFGRRPDLTARQDRLVPPRELGFDDPGTAVVFRVENQYCAEWGVAAAGLASTDPPVYVRDRSRGGWEPFLDRVSVACVEMVLSEVLLGGREAWQCVPAARRVDHGGRIRLRADGVARVSVVERQWHHGALVLRAGQAAAHGRARVVLLAVRTGQDPGRPGIDLRDDPRALGLSAGNHRSI